MALLAALFLAASLGLAQPPMIGVACPRQPNLTTCGRIGIAVWLTHRATSATADLAGAHVRLHAGGFGGRGPKYWEGYVHLSRQRLGLPTRWYGTKPVKFLRLHLEIHYPTRVASVTIRLQLRPGWG